MQGPDHPIASAAPRPHGDAPCAPASPVAEIRRLSRTGDAHRAAILLADLLRARFGLMATGVQVIADRYSLNSAHGLFEADGRGWFFKFHEEEGEAAMRGEYYRAGLLADAGLPVDRPAYVSSEPGAQVLVYPRRDCPRFADALRALDLDPRAAPFGIDHAAALALEGALCDRMLAVYRATLHPITKAQSAAEPIHRLFHARLTDAEGRFPGGRFASFYPGRAVALPGATLLWEDLAARRWRLNGAAARDTLATLFARAGCRLAPGRMADAGGVTAHGDAHAANLWIDRDGGVAPPRLTLFDPAFAGDATPSLLAEIKPTFHNVFAHPLWLYDPAEASARFAARATRSPGWIEAETDWRLTPVRRALLRVKAERLWRPWLATLAARALLPRDWRKVIRLGLFLCPTLVMDLRAGASRDPVASLIGFMAAVAAGSEIEGGADPVSLFLDAIDPAQDGAALDRLEEAAP